MRRKDMCAGVFRRLMASRIPAQGVEAQAVFTGVFIARLHADRDLDAARRLGPEKKDGIRSLCLVIVQDIAGRVPDNQVDVAADLIVAARKGEIGLAALDGKCVTRFLVLGERLANHEAPRGDLVALLIFAQPVFDPGMR